MTDTQVATAEPPIQVEGVVEEERQLPARSLASELIESAPVQHRSTSAEIAIAEAKAKAVASRFAAREYKRDTKEALLVILEECNDIDFAFKALSRREEKHEMDASIRLLELIATQYGNVEFGVRIFTRDESMSEIEVYARDTQLGSDFSDTFFVPHVMWADSQIKKVIIPVKITDLVSSETSKRLRKGLKKIILPTIIRKAVDRCKATIDKALENLEARKAKLIEIYVEMGVDKSQLQGFLKKDWHKVDRKDVQKLYGIYTAMHEGEIPIDKYFKAATLPTGAAPIALPQENDQEDKPSTPTKAKKPEKKQNTDPSPAPDAGSDSESSTTVESSPAQDATSDSPKTESQPTSSSSNSGQQSSGEKEKAAPPPSQSSTSGQQPTSRKRVF